MKKEIESRIRRVIGDIDVTQAVRGWTVIVIFVAVIWSEWQFAKWLWSLL